MFAIVSLLGAAAVLAADPTSAAEDRGLRFAWPANGSALVELSDERRVGDISRTSVVSMRLTVSPDTPADRVLIHFSERQAISGGGRSLESVDPAVIGVEVARVLARATPDMVVDASGGFVEARDLDTTLHAVLDACGFPGERLGIGAFRDSLESYAAEDWNAWVGSWRGLRLAPGEWQTRETEIPFHGVPTRVRLTRRGLVPDAPDRIRLQSIVEYPSDAVRSYTGGFLLDLAIEAKELGEDPFVNIRFLDRAKYSPMTETTTVDFDGTMRPLVVERVRTFSAAGGRHEVDGVERRVHTFTWSDEPVASPGP